MMDYAPPPSEIGIVELVADETPATEPRINGASSPTPANGIALRAPRRQPATERIARPSTLRLRGRLDDVMARLHAKLDGFDDDAAQGIAEHLDPKATRMARQAFSPADLELPDDDAA